MPLESLDAGALRAPAPTILFFVSMFLAFGSLWLVNFLPFWSTSGANVSYPMFSYHVFWVYLEVSCIRTFTR